MEFTDERLLSKFSIPAAALVSPAGLQMNGWRLCGMDGRTEEGRGIIVLYVYMSFPSHAEHSISVLTA